MIIRADILIMPVLHKKSARNYTKLLKAQALIEVPGRSGQQKKPDRLSRLKVLSEERQFLPPLLHSRWRSFGAGMSNVLLYDCLSISFRSIIVFRSFLMSQNVVSLKFLCLIYKKWKQIYFTADSEKNSSYAGEILV